MWTRYYILPKCRPETRSLCWILLHCNRDRRHYCSPDVSGYSNKEKSSCTCNRIKVQVSTVFKIPVFGSVFAVGVYKHVHCTYRPTGNHWRRHGASFGGWGRRVSAEKNFRPPKNAKFGGDSLSLENKCFLSIIMY